jgi:hypothetical protein
MIPKPLHSLIDTDAGAYGWTLDGNRLGGVVLTIHAPSGVLIGQVGADGKSLSKKPFQKSTVEEFGDEFMKGFNKK